MDTTGVNDTDTFEVDEAEVQAARKAAIHRIARQIKDKRPPNSFTAREYAIEIHGDPKKSSSAGQLLSRMAQDGKLDFVDINGVRYYFEKEPAE